MQTDSNGSRPWTHRLAAAWRALRRPVSAEKRALLAARWRSLPAALRTDRQIVGRQLVHCSYLLGPSYCSFGCTHCYLPANANRVPLPDLGELLAQIEANRRLQGPDSGIQITGGDVVDAYWRAGRSEELVEVVRYACDAGLVPMLMTHGQVLLERPTYLERLVTAGGLRKIAIHIDVTQAGRPGYPIRQVRRESDLHPLRDAFVDLLLGVRRRTRAPLSAAMTVTVTERNIGGIAEILDWLVGDPRRLEAFGMVSLQTEADVGRTRFSARPVRPEAVIEAVERTYGIELGPANILAGDPDCTRFTTLLVRPADGAVVNLIPDDPPTRRFVCRTLAVFGGVGSRGVDRWRAAALRLGALVRRPLWLVSALGFGLRWVSHDRSRLGLLRDFVRGRARPLTVVLHNFMSRAMIEAGGAEVERRLAACAFKGVVRQGDAWTAVPMCSMNALEREVLYEAALAAPQARKASPGTELVSLSQSHPSASSELAAASPLSPLMKT
jgi:hypothetical protein